MRYFSKDIGRKLNGKILITLENEEQVKDCLSWINEISGEKRIIALSPQAMYELERHNVNFKIPEDYYDSDELYQREVDNYPKVMEMCGLIDRIIKQYSNDAFKFNVNTAKFTIRHINTIYSVLTTRIFQLSKIIECEKPDLVFAYETNIYPFGRCKSAPYIFFDEKESIYTRLLLLDRWSTCIHILKYNEKINKKSHINNNERIEKKSMKVRNFIKSFLEIHPRMYDMVLNVQKNGFPGLSYIIRKKFSSGKNYPVILYGGGYNWDDSIDELLNYDIGPIFRVPDDFIWLLKCEGINSGEMDAAWQELKENDDFRKFFLFNGIDFSSIVFDRFEFIVKQLTPVSLQVIRYTMKLIKKNNIRSIVASTFASCAGHSVARAAHNCGLPVITWQHGGYGAMENHLVEYMDFMQSDIHFVFGDGVVETHIESAKKYGTKLISVGSSSIERLKKVESKSNVGKNKKKIILYATDIYQRNNQYMTSPPPLSDILLWQTQESILKLLGTHQECNIIVKLHPSEAVMKSLIKSYIQDKGFNNFQLIGGEKSFTEVMTLADIIIIDRPFTTILQALTTRKPIFIYNGLVYYNKNAENLLSKRAICATKLEDLLNKLEAYLSKDEYNANVESNEFLEMYGTTSKRGSPGERAAKELIKIMKEFH